MDTRESAVHYRVTHGHHTNAYWGGSTSHRPSAFQAEPGIRSERRSGPRRGEPFGCSCARTDRQRRRFERAAYRPGGAGTSVAAYPEGAETPSSFATIYSGKEACTASSILREEKCCKSS